MNTIRNHVAQVLMIRADASSFTNPLYKQALFHLIEQGIGGIGVFLGGLEETAAMIVELQNKGEQNLLIAADYEFGLPMRLDGGIAFPRAMALGQTLPGITGTRCGLYCRRSFRNRCPYKLGARCRCEQQSKQPNYQHTKFWFPTYIR